MDAPLANPERVGIAADVSRDREHTRVPFSVLPFSARLALPIGLSVAACGLLVWYVSRHQEQWQTVLLASPWLLPVCAVASLASSIVPGVIYWVMTSRVGRDVGLAESIWLAVMTGAVNAVVPLHESWTASRVRQGIPSWWRRRGGSPAGHFFDLIDDVPGEGDGACPAG